VFLSQLLVSPGKDADSPRPGLDWIRQTYRVHQRIWMAFPDTHRVAEDPFFLGTWSANASAKPKRQDGGFLFRIEPESPLRILVQSLEKPNWEYAFRNASHLLVSAPQVREFDPAIEAGQSYRFRLVAQMVTRRTIPAGKLQKEEKARSEHPIRCLLPESEPGTGKRSDPDFTAWRERLTAWSERHGFTAGEYPKHLRVQPVSNLFMKPTGQERPKRFNAAMFEGLLTCTNPELLREAVVNGVGRGKAFGMGLLSLARLR
jgi:CRISPR system Cascade subunit CasE